MTQMLAKKYKFSQRNQRFICNPENHRNSEEKCLSRYSNEILNKFHIRCESKDQKDSKYLEYCKKIEENYKNQLKKNPKKDFQKERMKNLKRCEVCYDINNIKYLMYCNICEDGYHCYCLNPALDSIEDEVFTCQKCEDDNTHFNPRQTTVEESFSYYIKRNIKKCFKCKNEIKENLDESISSNNSSGNRSEKTSRSKSLRRNSEKKIFSNKTSKKSKSKNKKENYIECYKNCIRCKKDFHTDCFSGNINLKIKINSTNLKIDDKKICFSCEDLIKQKIKTTKISDYFKAEKIPKLLGQKIKKPEDDITSCSSEGYTNNNLIMFNFDDKKNSNVTYYPKFNLWNKILSEEKKSYLKANLFKALLFKDIDFSDDLAFMDPDCLKEMNNSKLEPGIQKMSPYNKKIFYKFKEKSRKGEYPGLEILEDDIQGYIVRASEEIKKNTLICEYTGEVTLLRKKLFDTNDSIMELIRTPSSNTALVICPEKKGNIARFISGINNFDKNSKKKKNINSGRYDVDGKVIVLLYASKTIKKLDILYYDYNAGGSECYPTKNFI